VQNNIQHRGLDLGDCRPRINGQHLVISFLIMEDIWY